MVDALGRFARERERALRAEALAAESRLAMLRYELNPHFRFNALNSVIGVIREDPGKAQSMVRQLAELLRYALTSHGASTVEVEVHVAQQYLAIEQVRFEERLAVVVEIPDALWQESVPPMLLQPLVENAIKHGMGDVPLRVRISAAREGGELRFTVANNGRLVEAGAGTGVGLRNLRERVQLAHPAATVSLAEVGAEVHAVVRLPRERG